MKNKDQIFIFIAFGLLMGIFIYFIVERDLKIEHYKKTDGFILIDGKSIGKPFRHFKNNYIYVEYYYNGVRRKKTYLQKDVNYYLNNDVYYDVKIAKEDSSIILITEKLK